MSFTPCRIVLDTLCVLTPGRHIGIFERRPGGKRSSLTLATLTTLVARVRLLSLVGLSMGTPCGHSGILLRFVGVVLAVDVLVAMAWVGRYTATAGRVVGRLVRRCVFTPSSYIGITR